MQFSVRNWFAGALLISIAACNTVGTSSRPNSGQSSPNASAETRNQNNVSRRDHRRNAAAGPAERQMRRYMQFYFPSSGNARYDIGFKWGTYWITTHAKRRTKVHRSARRYRGFMTMRPSRRQSRRGERLWLYLITPRGAVWRRPVNGRIAQRSVRREVKRRGGMTSTRVIKSYSEPLIDHFRDHRRQWRRYGKLVWKRGARKSRLKLRRRR
jgi:hypothetical protein